MPRDLDPAINDLDGCYLYDIDDLERGRGGEPRRPAGRRPPARRRSSREEAERFRAWQPLARRRARDRVAARARAEEIRARELGARAKLGGASSPTQRRAVESLTAQIVNKLLHLPTVRMKEAAAGAEGAVYADTVRHLFELRRDER